MPRAVIVGAAGVGVVLSVAAVGLVLVQPGAHAPASALRPTGLARLAPGQSGLPSAAPPEPPVFQFQALSPQEAFKINESVPVSTLPNPMARAFVFPTGHEADRVRALQCLTQAVYYEAGSEAAQGQQAIAQVVLNRVRDPMFPKSVCAVVFQGADRLTGCQFTFTCDGSLSRAPTPAGWTAAQDVADRALNGYVERSVGYATHYHTVWVVPYWSPTLLKVAHIGAHIFYRWTGGAGLPSAFNGVYAGGEPTELAALPAVDSGLISQAVAPDLPVAADAQPRLAISSSAPSLTAVSETPSAATLAPLTPVATAEPVSGWPVAPVQTAADQPPPRLPVGLSAPPTPDTAPAAVTRPTPNHFAVPTGW